MIVFVFWYSGLFGPVCVSWNSCFTYVYPLSVSLNRSASTTSCCDVVSITMVMV